jgi:hypothetical protein
MAVEHPQSDRVSAAVQMMAVDEEVPADPEPAGVLQPEWHSPDRDAAVAHDALNEDPERRGAH